MKKKVSKSKDTKVIKKKASKKKTENHDESFRNKKIILIVLSFLIIAVLLFVNFNTEDMENGNETIIDIPKSSGGEVRAIVINDPECSECQIENYMNQVKANLFPSLEYEFVDYRDQTAQNIIKSLDLKYLPAVFFSKNIDESEAWEFNLKNVFRGVSISDQQLYFLQYEYLPIKTLFEELEVPGEPVIIGNGDSQVKMYVFANLGSPFVSIFIGNDKFVEEYRLQSPTFEPSFENLKKDYIDTGKIDLVFINTPDNSNERYSFDLHVAALCANENGRWYDYIVRMMEGFEDVTSKIERKDLLASYALEVGLDPEEFRKCLGSGKFDEQILKEMEFSSDLGITRAPTVFVNKISIPGAYTYEMYKTTIDVELEK